MKYPQLVPTRAVNAISDWLVTRLEQLGVDSPHIYTRLLLSLLQTTVQINDPNELNNLEAYLASRKGGNRRYLACDTDTLKKLNAVHCLQDIVSQEQDISTIENLVDELCEKLKEIERQNTDDVQEESELVTTVVTAVANLTKQQQTEQHHHHQQYLYNCIKHHNKKQQELGATIVVNKCNASHGGAAAETDPKKRYFRAFPALTKEMEDSFRLWRRNAKSLTWPVERSNLTLLQSSNNKHIIHKQAAASARIDEQTATTATATITTTTTTTSTTTVYLHEHEQASREQLANTAYDKNNVQQQAAGGAAASGGVKRKSKRRRNQALPKGRTNQNIRKNSIGSGAVIADGRLVGAGGAAAGGNRYQRNASPTYWDTDFEGCWEMGRDLIKEFLIKQNKGSNPQQRNRSTSESAAYNMMLRENDGATEESDEAQTNELQAFDEGTNSPFMPAVDISFCCEDDYVAHNEEIGTPPPQLVADISAQRRLYQRDANVVSPIALKPADMMLPKQQQQKSNDALTTDADDNDFEQFKAKFNSSIEALWKNTALDDQQSLFSQQQCKIVQSSEANNNITSAPAVVVAPFKENLRNFWTNYLSSQQQCDAVNGKAANVGLYPIAKEQQRLGMSLSCSIGSYANDLTNTSDYYSMPNNFDDFDKSIVGGNSNATALSTTASNVFLQNSIWSNNSQYSGGESDESFYYKVWNSNKRLDAMQGVKLNKLEDETAYILPPYKASSKWSEGINAGPHMQQQQSHTQLLQQQPQHLLQPQQQLRLLIDNNHQASSLGTTTDYTDSSTTVSLTSSWQTPVGCSQYNNLQPDLQSWSASNPISLTEMYESNVDTVDSSNSKSVANANEVIAPSITLPNHCPNTSGFVEYARVKTVLKPRTHELFMQRQQYVAQLMLRPRERFPENENLLTSQRTHFNPINSFIDGHTFEISSALDVIEYERSSSGSLYLDADKYIEYTRNDSLMGEEDATESADVSATASTAPLYATSNCEAATARKTAAHDNFIIRFALRNCEVGCQTDVNILQQTQLNVLNFEQQLYQQQNARSDVANQQQHPLYMIFANNQMPLQTDTALACNDAIQALNKAVAAAAKAVSLGDCNSRAWVPKTTVGCDMDNYRASQGIWQRSHSHIKQLLDTDTNELDELDGCGGSMERQQQQWSMHAIGKQCMLKGHQRNSSNSSSTGNLHNNNNNENTPSNNNNCIDDEQHSLWSMCAACNNEYKSVPANRLLRDELQLEADEIMSDLKYMQDLYIGRAPSSLDGHSDATTNCADDMCPVSMENNNNTAHGIMTANEWLLQDYDDSMHATNEPLLEENHIEEMPQETHAVIEKVNRLIVDLLTAENKANFLTQSEMVISSETDSLWYGNNNSSANIWQERDQKDVLKPIDLIRHFTNEPMSQENADKSEQLKWEHSNLAEIWRKNDTPPASPAQPQAVTPVVEKETPQTIHADMNLGKVLYAQNHKESDTQLPAALDENVTTTSEADNFNNFARDDIFAAQGVFSSNAYKRIQQFLSSNGATNGAAKLKLSNRKRRHSASQNYFYHNTSAGGGNTAIPMAQYNATTTELASTPHLINKNNNNKNNYNNNNNNSIDVADLNCFNMKLKNFANNKQQQAIGLTDRIMGNAAEQQQLGDVKVADEDILMEQQQQAPKQTIITCKYWTTLEPSVNLLDLSNAAIINDTTQDHFNIINDADGDIIGGTTFSCLIDKNARILKHVTMLTRPLTR